MLVIFKSTDTTTHSGTSLSSLSRKALFVCWVLLIFKDHCVTTKLRVLYKMVEEIFLPW